MKEQIMQKIIEKQDELVKHLSKLLHSYEYEVIDGNSKWQRLESELADLKRELEECEDDEWDNLKDFNQPLDKPIEL